MPRVETYATAAEAVRALGPGARFLGGGSLVMIDVNHGALGVERIVRTTDPALRGIRVESDRITLGAHATMAEVAGARDLAFLAPAALAVGGPAVRNAATVGGNLFAPHPYGDFAVALLALGATVHVADGQERPLDEFLDERSGLVTSVSFRRPDGGAFRFRKVRRVRPAGASVMCMAALLNRSAGRLSNVCVAYGGMAARPVRARAAETALEGVPLDRGGVRPALERAVEGLDPPTDALASSWYRRETAPVQLRRLLLGEDRG